MESRFNLGIEHGIALAIIALFSSIFLGFSGFRTVVGLFILMVPFYLILKRFDLEEGERIIFSLFAGLMILPSLTYWLGFLVPFRISMIIIFALAIASAYFINVKAKAVQ